MIGLMQIAEPGMSAAPHEERLAVGIDLGTTNSLVATVVNGAPEVIRDEQGRALLPSVVRFRPDGAIEVGHEAAASQESDPLNTISSAKRLIGRGKADLDGGIILPYQFEDAAGMVQIRTRAGVKSPVEVSAQVLSALRARAEERLGGERTLTMRSARRPRMRQSLRASMCCGFSTNPRRPRWPTGLTAEPRDCTSSTTSEVARSTCRF